MSTSQWTISLKTPNPLRAAESQRIVLRVTPDTLRRLQVEAINAQITTGELIRQMLCREMDRLNRPKKAKPL